MPDVVTITGPEGEQYQIINPGPGRVGSKLANGEPYEKKLLLDVYRLGLSGTAFDIGAHIGNHSLWLAAVCGFNVHAWEPHDGSRDCLYENLTLNPLLDVEVYGWAAGREDGRGRLTSDMSVVGQGDEPLTLDRGHVQVHAIDDRLDVDDLAIIKVDVEGMEADALAGCIDHIGACLPVIYCEAHTAESSNSVAEVLGPFGYRMDLRIEMGSPMERWRVL